MLSPQYNPINTPVLDQARQSKAREYSRKHRILGLLEMGISLVLLLILIFSGFSKPFINLFPLALLLKATLYFVILVLAFGILILFMLIIGVIGSLISPLMNSYTRHIENQADEYALSLTKDSKAFIESMTRLTNQNLSVAFPSRWEEFLFRDHPSFGKRVEHAKIFQATRVRDKDT
jgi:Zn-dependent protease with chaperone function